MSMHTFEDDYTCRGGCHPAGCQGHETRLNINTTAKTYYWYKDNVLRSYGSINDLDALGSLMMQAGDAGVLS